MYSVQPFYQQVIRRRAIGLKTNILYYTEPPPPSNYWFYDPYLTLICYVIIYVKWGISLDEIVAVLQIISGNMDNFGIIVHNFDVKTYSVTHH